MTRIHAVVCAALLAVGAGSVGLHADGDVAERPRIVEFRNGRWFDGNGFQPRRVFSVDGRFTFREPPRIDKSYDLAGAFVVPPFAEAHNHNIGGGVDERAQASVKRYLDAGVFYVKVQGNWPLDAAAKERLGLNRPDGLDVMFAHGSLTASGGHPIGLAATLLKLGAYPGQTLETMRDRYYFTIDSAAELDRYKDDPAVVRKGLDPRVLALIVRKAHTNGLRVTTHVTTAADFRNAIAAGGDEIAHVPLAFVPTSYGGPSDEPLTAADARLAIEHGVTVITTLGAPGLIKLEQESPPAEGRQVREGLIHNLALLSSAGVRLALGSDNVTDTSHGEADVLLKTGVFDRLSLLRLWTGATARAIFPGRRIGALDEGYEASFVALDGNPLEAWENVHRIRLRFKQGVLLQH
jgi:Amidohydrolase family